jgi:RimJ/RimL family protein N-acetyltransferase
MHLSSQVPTGDDDVDLQRQLIRPLLVPTDPADALTAYYALMHDPRRTSLRLHHTPGGYVDGFAAVCQTGRDLFVPLVVMRAPHEVVRDLLLSALQPGRPYTLILGPPMRDAVAQTMSLEDERVNAVLEFDPRAYREVVNVMVQPGRGTFRFEIRVGEEAASAAGVNWHSDQMAEMYIYTRSDYQGRGWGRAVGTRCIQAILEAHLLPLYTVREDNAASLRLAEELGFRDNGVREFECLGQLLP